MIRLVAAIFITSILSGCGGGTICYRLDSWGPTSSSGETSTISPAKCHMQYLNEVWFQEANGDYWLSVPETDSHVTFRANPLPTQNTWEFRSTLVAENNGGVAFYNRNYSCNPNNPLNHLCNVTFGQKECVFPLEDAHPITGGCLIEAVLSAPDKTEIDQ